MQACSCASLTLWAQEATESWLEEQSLRPSRNWPVTSLLCGLELFILPSAP